MPWPPATRSLLPRSFYRFLAGGVVNTAASYAVYFGLLYVCGYLLAYDIAYGFGLALSFVINGRYVFGNNLTVRRGVEFCVANFIQYLYQLAVLWIVVDRLGLPKWLGLIVAIGSFIPPNYLLTRFVFRHRTSTPGLTPPADEYVAANDAMV